jgi:soluble lytic murein transglycosylase-like protein
MRTRHRDQACEQRTHYRLLLPLLVLLTLAVYGNAKADIYRYVNADGVATFTNMRPNSGRYETVVREREVGRGAEKPGPVALVGRVNPVRGYPTAVRSRYAGQIQAAASASNLDPQLLHAVISAESGYNPSARSRAGAVGLMQLMPQTAARYSVIDRLDPHQNIHGGARYLRDLLQMFNNDLTLALAAYNAGEQAVVKYGNRVPPYRETVAYVPKVMTYYRTYRSSSL